MTAITGTAAPSSPAPAPLRQRAFPVLRSGAIAGDVDLPTRNTASARQMTELAPSPVTVALVQAAGTPPVLLPSFAAGALAIGLDRRWLHVLPATVALAILLTSHPALSSAAAAPARTKAVDERHQPPRSAPDKSSPRTPFFCMETRTFPNTPHAKIQR